MTQKNKFLFEEYEIVIEEEPEKDKTKKEDDKHNISKLGYVNSSVYERARYYNL